MSFTAHHLIAIEDLNINNRRFKQGDEIPVEYLRFISPDQSQQLRRLGRRISKRYTTYFQVPEFTKDIPFATFFDAVATNRFLTIANSLHESQRIQEVETAHPEQTTSDETQSETIANRHHPAHAHNRQDFMGTMISKVFVGSQRPWREGDVLTAETSGTLVYDEPAAYDEKSRITNYPPDYCDMSSKWVSCCISTFNAEERSTKWPNVFTNRKLVAQRKNKGAPALIMGADDKRHYAVVFGNFQLVGNHEVRSLIPNKKAHQNTTMAVGDVCLWDQDVQTRSMAKSTPPAPSLLPITQADLQRQQQQPMPPSPPKRRESRSRGPSTAPSTGLAPAAETTVDDNYSQDGIDVSKYRRNRYKSPVRPISPLSHTASELERERAAASTERARRMAYQDTLSQFLEDFGNISDELDSIMATSPTNALSGRLRSLSNTMVDANNRALESVANAQAQLLGDEEDHHSKKRKER